MTGIVIAGVAHSHVDYVVEEVRTRDDLQLLGVYDSDRSAAEAVAAEFAVPVFDHLDELLALRPEIVACAGVYAERAGIVVAALESGADVLCDKPLCIASGELDEVASAAQQSGHSIALMLDKRTYPETLALRAASDAGVLGVPVAFSSWAPHKLLRADRAPWFLSPATYGDILSDLLVHDVDIALQLTGARSGTVRGWFGPAIDTGFHVSGGAVVTFDGPSRSVLTAEVDWLTPTGSDIHGDYRLRVVGTSGTAELYWGRGRAEITTVDAPRRDLDVPESLRPAEAALDALLSSDERSRRVTAESLLVSRIAILASESARDGGAELRWEAGS